jgi:hypothetical protein
MAQAERRDFLEVIEDRHGLRSTIVATDGNAPSLDSASTNLHSTPYRCSDDACSAPLDTWSCTQHGTCTNLVFLTVILAPH